VTKIY